MYSCGTMRMNLLRSGSLNTNGATVTTPSMRVSDSITLGASMIHLTGTGTVWDSAYAGGGDIAS